MLFSARPLQDMGAPPVPARAVQPRHFPQWSRTAILTLSSEHDDELTDVKKSPPDAAGPGFIIGGDPAARVSHLEHSVRFLQEQHRLMLSGLHAEIEALRERNRDLQFQLIFKQESTSKPASPANEETSENSEEAKLKREVTRLEKEATSARSEARAAEARALQLQRLVDAQAEKLRELEIKPKCTKCMDGGTVAQTPTTALNAAAEGSDDGEEGTAESRAALRARLADAERLVRRLRAEAERRRRELQCMKNSLHASLRTAATGLDGYGFQNNYHFPPVHTPDFWREPIRDEYGVCGRGRGCRPLTLPELAQPRNRSTVYVNHHTRPRANGYENKNKRQQSINGDLTHGKSPEETQENRLSPNYLPTISAASIATYPELKIVVTKIIPHGNVNGQTVNGQAVNGQMVHGQAVNGQTVHGQTVHGQAVNGQAIEARARRRTHRKQASEHT